LFLVDHPHEALRSSWGLELNMPKMKTHKGSAKRFRVSANGKLKRVQAGKKHLNSHKSGKRKRHLRAKITEVDRVAQKYVEHI
jgi:large subunit ribosomal protein L35